MLQFISGYCAIYFLRSSNRQEIEIDECYMRKINPNRIEAHMNVLTCVHRTHYTHTQCMKTITHFVIYTNMCVLQHYVFFSRRHFDSFNIGFHVRNDIA